MDFMSGLPRSLGWKNTIWVIVDRLTKSAHFLSIRTTDPIEKLCRKYIDEVVHLHGVPVSIVSDHDS